MYSHSDLDNVLFKHGGLACLLPFTVYLDFGYLPDTRVAALGDNVEFLKT